MPRKLLTSLLFTLCITFSCGCLLAHEGMWLVHLLDKNLRRELKQTGLKMDPRLIYNEDAIALSDAVVSMQFGCTGSMISQNGLLITNHHCAYSDIHALSTPENNYLENGFWAMEATAELPIPGKSVLFLRKVFDVTDQVKQLRETMTSRKLSAVLERQYAERTGMECQLVSMWKGSLYYLFCYQEYNDVRLVGAPPVQVANFGGDAENWEWPQQKCDFALYRVYTGPNGEPAPYAPENVPLVPKKSLAINTRGIQNGDFAMVMGYPYSTNRYISSYQTTLLQKTTHPILVEMTKEHMAIMQKGMNASPVTRLQYADSYFGISNVSELREGEVMSLTRHRVAEQKAAQERLMQEWITTQAPDSCRSQWQEVLSQLEQAYEATKEITAAKTWFQQTLVASEFLTMARRSNNLRTLQRKDAVDTVRATHPLCAPYLQRMKGYYQGYNEAIEKEWFTTALVAYCTHVPPTYWGAYLKSRYQDCGGEAHVLARDIWEHSLFASPRQFDAFFDAPVAVADVLNDPAVLLCESETIATYNRAEQQAWTGTPLNQLNNRYTHALYQYRLAQGEPQYPDANATMRLTFGTVGPLYPQDGVACRWYSTTQGLWDKWNPAHYDFTLPPKMLELLESGDWGRWASPKDGSLHTNFICDLDITGGNSGSPVMDAHGNLVGLAYDGNKESLGGDLFFHKDLNKCVCVDIRYVLWVIEKYAGAQYLLQEMNLIF